ncbi:putative methyltransferase [Escovopsis weberi]|uniref:Putative methyltransferase n=1 Tax=Escovopsis weberi TaxID=150374 RepID=A0A0M8MYS6_ESCWE|nr:putative methyltransferase [Escovopsis weberi]
MNKYFAAGNKAVSSRFARRNVENSVSYILPVLNSLPPPFTFLDVGCGPASITIDIAQRYPSSTVMGVDRAEAIEEARENASKAGVSNVRFAVGDALQLAAAADTPGFEAVRGGCDVVHTHQLHMHVPDSLALMRQLRLAAKPRGGYVCCREADLGSATFSPATRAIESLARMSEIRLKDPYVGGKLKQHAVAAGFKEENCSTSVDTWLYDTPEQRRGWVELVISSMPEKPTTEMPKEFQGLDLDQVRQALRDWADTQDAWYKLPCPQIVCRRDD